MHPYIITSLKGTLPRPINDPLKRHVSHIYRAYSCRYRKGLRASLTRSLAIAPRIIGTGLLLCTVSARVRPPRQSDSSPQRYIHPPVRYPHLPGPL